jgi:hypothetical protein
VLDRRPPNQSRADYDRLGLDDRISLAPQNVRSGADVLLRTSLGTSGRTRGEIKILWPGWPLLSHDLR